MTKIQEGSPHCTVIVTVDADPGIMADLESHARKGLELFAKRKGFISEALHKSTDGGRLVQYLQWETEKDHLECLNDPKWDAIPSTQRFMELVRSGQAKIDVRVYNVMSCESGRHVQ